eukprot:2324258-Amphidinium_carterae.1
MNTKRRLKHLCSAGPLPTIITTCNIAVVASSIDKGCEPTGAELLLPIAVLVLLDKLLSLIHAATQ